MYAVFLIYIYIYIEEEKKIFIHLIHVRYMAISAEPADPIFLIKEP